MDEQNATPNPAQPLRPGTRGRAGAGVRPTGPRRVAAGGGGQERAASPLSPGSLEHELGGLDVGVLGHGAGGQAGGRGGAGSGRNTSSGAGTRGGGAGWTRNSASLEARATAGADRSALNPRPPSPEH